MGGRDEHGSGLNSADFQFYDVFALDLDFINSA